MTLFVPEYSHKRRHRLDINFMRESMEINLLRDRVIGSTLVLVLQFPLPSNSWHQCLSNSLVNGEGKLIRVPPTDISH